MEAHLRSRQGSSDRASGRLQGSAPPTGRGSSGRNPLLRIRSRTDLVRWNLALAALAASWGFIAVLVAAVDLGAEALAFWRLALAAATLALVALATRRLDRLAPGAGSARSRALGVVQGAHWLLFFEAVKHGSVALAVLTFYAAPLFIAVAAPFVLGERTSRVVLGACLVGGARDRRDRPRRGGDGAVTAAAVAAGLAAPRPTPCSCSLSKRLLRRRSRRSRSRSGTASSARSPSRRRSCSPIASCPTAPGEWGAVLVLGVVFTGLSTLALRAAAAPRRRRRRQASSRSSSRSPASCSPGRCSTQRPARRARRGALVLAAGVAVVVLEPTEAPVAMPPVGVGSGAE